MPSNAEYIFHLLRSVWVIFLIFTPNRYSIEIYFKYFWFLNQISNNRASEETIWPNETPKQCWCLRMQTILVDFPDNPNGKRERSDLAQGQWGYEPCLWRPSWHISPLSMLPQMLEDQVAQFLPTQILQEMCLFWFWLLWSVATHQVWSRLLNICKSNSIFR